MHCMDDCVDLVGHAMYVNKSDLLKGYWQVPLSLLVCVSPLFLL